MTYDQAKFQVLVNNQFCYVFNLQIFTYSRPHWWTSIHKEFWQYNANIAAQD